MIVASEKNVTLFRRNAATLRSLPRIVLFVVGYLTIPGCVQADDGSTSDLPQMSVLDGKTFQGEIGLLGESTHRQDVLIFRDGKFLSQECQQSCGYTDGPYWVRSEGDDLQFTVETPCLKADATMVWTGTLKNGEIEGTMKWTSERWYWTIEKDYWFKVKLVETEVSATE